MRLPSLLTVLAALALCTGAARGAGAQATATRAANGGSVSGERWTVSDGVWLRYRVVGNGPPLVLLHGFNDDIESLLPLAQTLGRDHRVIVLDQRGFGQSGKPLNVADYGTAYVRDVVQLLDELQLQRADVLGHSLGALVAAKLAAQYPGRVRKLVLAAPVVYRDSSKLARLLAPTVASLARGGGTSPLMKALSPTTPSDAAMKAFDVQVLKTNDPRSLLAAARSFPQLTVDARELGRARIPTLAVGGTRDPLSDSLQELGAWWPGIATAQLDGATHEGIVTDPRLAAKVREFLARP